MASTSHVGRFQAASGLEPTDHGHARPQTKAVKAREGGWQPFEGECLIHVIPFWNASRRETDEITGCRVEHGKGVHQGRVFVEGRTLISAR